MIETLPKDISKTGLLEREKHYFLILDNLVNRQSPIRTREEHLEYMRQWNIENGHTAERRERAKLKQRQYRLKKKMAHTTSDCPDPTTEDTVLSQEDKIYHS